MLNTIMLPEAVGNMIETVIVGAKAEILAPGLGFAGTAVARYLVGRYDAARTILRSELERVGVTAQDFNDAEQFAAGALRYARAVRDQAAEESLRLLAQAMAGLAKRHELWASDFLKIADIIAPLSRDELILIGRMMMEQDRRFYATPRPPRSEGDYWRNTVDEVIALFPSESHMLAVATRAQRSGLILPIVGNIDVTGFYLSPIGREVRDIVNVEAALKT